MCSVGLIASVIRLLTIKQKHSPFPFQIWNCERKTKTFVTQILYCTCKNIPVTAHEDMINNLKKKFNKNIIYVTPQEEEFIIINTIRIIVERITLSEKIECFVLHKSLGEMRVAIFDRDSVTRKLINQFNVN